MARNIAFDNKDAIARLKQLLKDSFVGNKMVEK
jgi:hypothetical protein